MLGSKGCGRELKVTRGFVVMEGCERTKGTKEVKGIKGTAGGRRLGALDRNLGRRRSSLVLATLAGNMPATAS